MNGIENWQLKMFNFQFPSKDRQLKIFNFHFSIFLFLLLICPSAGAATVRVPVSNLYVDFTLPPLTNTVYVTNYVLLTNYVVINTTNYVIVNAAPRPRLVMSGRFIDPAAGDYAKTIAEPTTFVLAPFAAQASTTLYLSNPFRAPITWPATIGTARLVWLQGGAVTNQARAAILFEEVAGEIWASSTP